jgi:hypothetical protein
MLRKECKQSAEYMADFRSRRVITLYEKWEPANLANRRALCDHHEARLAEAAALAAEASKAAEKA